MFNNFYYFKTKMQALYALQNKLEPKIQMNQDSVEPFDSDDDY